MQPHLTTQRLPVLYGGLEVLDTRFHQSWRVLPRQPLPGLARQNVVPLLGQELENAGKHFPIVFSEGDAPVPLALMGLDVGRNVLVDVQSGAFLLPSYAPAYLRRHPWILAWSGTERNRLSLCFDPTSDILTPDGEQGQPLFVDGELSVLGRKILAFCHAFESAATQTRAFVDTLLQHDLLKDGEVTIRSDLIATSSTYRGFRIVDGAKLVALPRDVQRAMIANGTMDWIVAHLSSLEAVDTLYRLGLTHKPGGDRPHLERTVSIGKRE